MGPPRPRLHFTDEELEAQQGHQFPIAAITQPHKLGA